MAMLRLGQEVMEAPVLPKDHRLRKVKQTQTTNVSANFEFKR